MRDIRNAKTDKKLSEKQLASISAIEADSESNKKITLKTEKDMKEQYKKAEKIRHHYFRTFYYSFAISFIVLGSLAILYFVYQQDKNIFGFSDKYYEDAINYIKNENYPKAESALVECLDVDPDHTNARVALANVYEVEAKYDDALKLLSEGIELSPRNETFYEMKIKLLTKTNRIADAMDFIHSISSSYIIVKLSEKRPTSIVMTPNPGTHDTSVTVNIISSSDATVYYTLDGTAPTTKSLVYDSNNPPKIDKGTVVIRAFAMNRNGMISDEYKATYRVYSENSAYLFKDEKIEQIVRASLNRPTETIYYRDIEQIKRLSNEEKGEVKYTGSITTLIDLLEMPNLQEVILLNEENITDFTPLQSLKSLSTLNLSGCVLNDNIVKQIFAIIWLRNLYLDETRISVIDNVKNISFLKEFSAADNSITNISPIENLMSLEKLDLSSNLISDLTPLSRVTSLKDLNISNNMITDIAPLSYLTKLVELDISANIDLILLDPISRLPNVEVLSVGKTKVQYLSPISGYTSLVSLKIDETLVTSLRDISGFINLATLDCSKTAITDFSVLAQMNIQNLIISSANITDISTISMADSVKTLDLSLNAVTDIYPLINMKNLRALNLSYNPVTNISFLQYSNSLESLTCISIALSAEEITVFRNAGINVTK